MDAQEHGRADRIDDILASQQALYRRLQASAASLWWELDLTMGQLKALQVIAHEGPLAIGRIATRLAVGKPAASLLVDALVRSGLVERWEDETDRRRTLAGLSPAGRDLVDRLTQGGRERMASWLRQLNDEDLAALARGLAALEAAAGREVDAPAADPSAGAGR